MRAVISTIANPKRAVDSREAPAFAAGLTLFLAAGGFDLVRGR